MSLGVSSEFSEAHIRIQSSQLFLQIHSIRTLSFSCIIFLFPSSFWAMCNIYFLFQPSFFHSFKSLLVCLLGPASRLPCWHLFLAPTYTLPRCKQHLKVQPGELEPKNSLNVLFLNSNSECTVCVPSSYDREATSMTSQ